MSGYPLVTQEAFLAELELLTSGQHVDFIGVLGRARTCDLRIRNPLLFQLSYEDFRLCFNLLIQKTEMS